MDLKEMYKLCIDSYNGTGGYLDGEYLNGFAREEDVSERLKNSYYENQIIGMIASAVEPVFGDKVSRSNMSAMYEAFTENVDMRGTTLTRWLQTVAQWHKLLGNVFIVMDNVVSPEKNLQKAIDTRSFPYLTYKTPDLVQDVKIGVNGNVERITFYLDSREVNGAKHNVYRTIKNGIVRDWYGDRTNPTYIGTPITSGSNSVIMTGSEPLPIPPFLSICQVSKAIYNMDSEQRDLERAQAFSILQIPGKQPEGSVQIGSKNAIYVDELSARDVKYVSPDANILQTLGVSSDRMSTRLKDQARNLGIRVIEKHYKSGDALELDYAPSYAIFANLSSLFSDLEYKIRDMFVLMSGQPDTTEIVYNKDYTPSPDKLMEDYNTLTSSMGFAWSPEQSLEIQNTSFDILSTLTGMKTIVATKPASVVESAELSLSSEQQNRIIKEL